MIVFCTHPQDVGLPLLHILFSVMNFLYHHLSLSFLRSYQLQSTQQQLLEKTMDFSETKESPGDFILRTNSNFNTGVQDGNLYLDVNW